MKTQRVPENMLSIRQASQLINVHTNTLRRWDDQGLLPSYRVGPRRDRRFHREDIAAFIGEPLYHMPDRSNIKALNS